MYEYIDTYLLSRGTVLSATSIVTYRSRLNKIHAYFVAAGCCCWADVQMSHIDALMFEMFEQGRKKSTRQNVVRTLKSFFRWLQDHGKIIGNYAKDISILRDRTTALPKPPLDEDEIEHIFTALYSHRQHALDMRNIAQMEVLYGCGLRLAECVALDVEDIDFQNRTLKVRNGKGDTYREVPLMKSALCALKSYMHESVRRSLLKGPDTGILFLNLHGSRATGSTFRQWITKLERLVGRPVHSHLFRHSIAVHLLRGGENGKGADIRTIQHFLGHVRLDTTKIYLRMDAGHLANEYNKAMIQVDVGL